MRSSLVAVTLTLASAACGAVDYKNTDLTNTKLEGTLVGSQCYEASPEIKLNTPNGQILLGCEANAPICQQACEQPSHALVKNYSGKTLTVTLGKSVKVPVSREWVHTAQEVSIKEKIAEQASTIASPTRSTPSTPSAANLATASTSSKIDDGTKASSKQSLPKPQYTDAQIKTLLDKVSKLKADMPAAGALAIMGQPLREQPISDRQRILVYPMSLLVNLYLDRQGNGWRIATSKLYTDPFCRYEDGRIQDNMGQKGIEVPGTNCIPRRFGPSGPASIVPGSIKSSAWQQYNKGRYYGDSGYVTFMSFYDPKSIVIDGSLRKVWLLDNYDSLQSSFTSPPYQSTYAMAEFSCDASQIAQGKFMRKIMYEYTYDNMGKGQVVRNERKKDPEWTDGNKDLLSIVCR